MSAAKDVLEAAFRLGGSEALAPLLEQGDIIDCPACTATRAQVFGNVCEVCVGWGRLWKPYFNSAVLSPSIHAVLKVVPSRSTR